MRSIPPTRPSSLALAAILALVGCGSVQPPASSPSSFAPSLPPSVAPSSGPTPSSAAPDGSSRPAAEAYAEIRGAVEEIRGLQPTKAVEPVTLDAAQLTANLTADFDHENTPDELRLAEDLLITLGLLPPGSKLRTIMLEFQSGQVAGYYSPDKDQLFVVNRSGGLDGSQMATYAHEFTHQLDDQVIGLDKLGLDVADQSDRQLARLALVEGDATSVQSTYMTENLTPKQLGEVLAAAADPKALEALQKAPPYVRETALFPYERGLAFVTTLIGTGGYAAVDAAFKSPPDSTEQILHAEKYVQREAPATVKLPDVAKALGPGWTAAGQDTLGELILSIWLTQGGVARGEANVAASGWGGDRLVLLRGPDDALGVGLVTTWDTAADASEFVAAASTAVSAREPDGVVASDGLRTVVVALGARAADVLAALGG